MCLGFRLALYHAIPKITSRIEIPALILVFNGDTSYLRHPISRQFPACFTHFAAFFSHGTISAVGWICMLVLKYIEDAIGGGHGH